MSRDLSCRQTTEAITKGTNCVLKGTVDLQTLFDYVELYLLKQFKQFIIQPWEVLESCKLPQVGLSKETLLQDICS